MQAEQFRKKYLGEITLRSGKRCFICFPVTVKDMKSIEEEAKKNYHIIMNSSGYSFVKEDELTEQQYIGVMAGQNKYGVRYWEKSNKAKRDATKWLDDYERKYKNEIKDSDDDIKQLQWDVMQIKDKMFRK